jgi:hypothetical protein
LEGVSFCNTRFFYETAEDGWVSNASDFILDCCISLGVRTPTILT